MPDWKPSFNYGNNCIANRIRPDSNKPYYMYNLSELPCLEQLYPLGSGYSLLATKCHIRAEIDTGKPIQDPFHATFEFNLVKNDVPGVVLGEGEYHVYLKGDGEIRLDQGRHARWEIEHPNAKQTAADIMRRSGIQGILQSFSTDAMANVAKHSQHAPLQELKMDNTNVPSVKPPVKKALSYQEQMAKLEADRKAKIRKQVAKENRTDLLGDDPPKKRRT